MAATLKCLKSQIWIGKDFFLQLENYLFLQKKKPILICDEKLKKDYGQPLQTLLGIDAIFLPSGESCKSEKIFKQLLEALFLKKVGRDGLLIALGGGSLLDLVGFIASIYLRGIGLVFYPTTLLAIVDAAIGGKTAINTSFGKNLIGSFYPADAIFCDFHMLRTLDEKELFNGYAEILKMALIYDPSIFEKATLEEKIYQAIVAKVEIVTKDPEDKGIRAILNFGHTIAHGLEAISSFQIPHGKAVAMGSLVEAFLSYEKKLLSSSDFAFIYALYQGKMGDFSRQFLQHYERKKFRESLYYDKKQKEGKVHCILLEKIGKVYSFGENYATSLSEETLEKGLDWMEKEFTKWPIP